MGRGIAVTLAAFSAIALVIAPGAAPAAPAPAEVALPAPLLGRWFDLVAGDVVINSEPQIYMYCPDGRVVLYGMKGLRSWRYAYRGGELCEEGGSWRACRSLRKTPDGYGLSVIGRDAVAVRFVPTEAGPHVPGCSTVGREELVTPADMQRDRWKRVH